VNEEGYLHFKVLRQIVHEIIKVVDILTIIVFHRLLKTLVKVKRQEVIFINPVKDQDLFLEFGVLNIVVCKD
jgi:hypothetical protein